MRTHRQYREVFHLCFLEWLRRISDPCFFVLKGGITLRFFFQSSRYSEDMDLDVHTIGVETLQKNGYKILKDASFRRVLSTYGIDTLDVNRPSAAKQTETTQRFRVGLVTAAGERLPTKVEFSRRQGDAMAVVHDLVHPDVVRIYGRRAFLFPHYTGPAMCVQKILALAGRSLTQARDAFDLYILFTGGHCDREYVLRHVPQTVLAEADRALASLTYEDYRGQVVPFLEEADQSAYGDQSTWQTIQQSVHAQLTP
jgi:predicted nucleotidyltransferase component of viral defense system